MRSKVNVTGPPIHPMLVHFPIGLPTTPVIVDVVHPLTGPFCPGAHSKAGFGAAEGDVRAERG